MHYPSGLLRDGGLPSSGSARPSSCESAPGGRDVVHAAIIEVAEEGTEAAAATAATMVAKAIRSPPAQMFRVDRPFLFAIVDETTGAVLFEGRIADPRQAS